MLATDGEPPRSTETNRKSGSLPQILAILLSLCLGLFLADAVISLADDSLLLFAGSNVFSIIRGIVSVLTALMSVGVYGLMALTPLVPKRLFLPVTLFNLAATLVLFPCAIYYYGHLQQIAWGMSACQVVLALWLVGWSQGGLRFRWLLVPVARLNLRCFSWMNSVGFILANVCLVLPAIIVYLFFCSSLAVDHFTDGFMALRPGGFTMQVRKYVRDDGKVIELFPMSHVADSDFYQHVSRTFPTNSIILMEGVTDSQNLLTNKISYQRMAKSLGLAEQHEAFAPDQGLMVRADVDVSQFSTNTIALLNLVMLIHVKGATPENVAQLLEYSPSPQLEDELIDDLLRNRNQHLLEEIHSHLKQADKIMVPWGVAHMPGVAKGILKEGFHLAETQEYLAISFHGRRNPPQSH